MRQRRQILPDSTIRSTVASYTTPHLSDVQPPQSSRRPELPFRYHGEGRVSYPQRSSPAKSTRHHLSFHQTQFTSRRNQRYWNNSTDRITSYISQLDIAGETARPASHVPGVWDFLLFWDRLLFVYHIEVGFSFL